MARIPEDTERWPDSYDATRAAFMGVPQKQPTTDFATTTIGRLLNKGESK